MMSSYLEVGVVHSYCNKLLFVLQQLSVLIANYKPQNAQHIPTSAKEASLFEEAV